MSTPSARSELPGEPTLVLLSPIGLDAGCWDWLALPPGVRVARPEHPGHGSRSRAAGPYDLDDLADEVVAKHPEPLDLVGISMGGMVAQHAALRYPEQVRSLMLACTGPSADPETMRERARVAEKEGVEAMIEETLRRWFTPAALAARPEHAGVGYARRTLLALDSVAFADAWRAIGSHDVRDRLDSIQAPTTCLAGGADPAAPPERMRALADGIPNARLALIDSAPHMAQLECPDAFGTELADHLRWVDGGS